MQGRGFDKDINALQKETGRQMRADNIPFVTVLAARDGKFFDYRVRTPASVSLPLTAEFFPPVRNQRRPGCRGHKSAAARRRVQTARAAPH